MPVSLAKTTDAPTTAREQFLSDVLSTAIEGGVNDWASVSVYRWDGLPERDHHAVIHAEGMPEEAQGERVDIDTIRRGLGRIQRDTVGRLCHPSYRSRFMAASRENDSDLDAYDAAIIVQAGLWDDVVFG